MTDQKRNQNQTREEPQGSEPQQTASRQDEQRDQGIGSASGTCSRRDAADTAADRGMDRERGNVGGPRER